MKTSTFAMVGEIPRHVGEGEGEFPPLHDHPADGVVRLADDPLLGLDHGKTFFVRDLDDDLVDLMGKAVEDHLADIVEETAEVYRVFVADGQLRADLLRDHTRRDGVFPELVDVEGLRVRRRQETQIIPSSFTPSIRTAWSTVATLFVRR